MLDLEYIEIDGLLYPKIEIGTENLESDLGTYGILRLRYLYEHRREMYRELLMTGKLSEHCRAIDKTAFERSERIQGARGVATFAISETVFSSSRGILIPNNIKKKDAAEPKIRGLQIIYFTIEDVLCLCSENTERATTESKLNKGVTTAIKIAVVPVLSLPYRAVATGTPNNI